MKTRRVRLIGTALTTAAAIATLIQIQAQDSPRPANNGEQRQERSDFPPGGGRPGGPGGPGGGPGGFGMGQIRPILKQFDKDGDGRLNKEERTAAREFMQSQRANGPGGRRFGGGPGGFGGGNQEPVKPGKQLTPADIKSYPGADVYDPQVIRTIFLELEGADWEKELIAFNNTDVDLSAKMTVDGKVYPDVGVHVRGMSSSMVPEGRKHSLNLDLDSVHEKQNLGGYRTLNLLNSHEDPSFLRSVLYSAVARDYIPTPKANFVRLVINGENWGIYINAQQFNKDFLRDFYKTTKGNRWKAPGSPGGRATLAYLGDDVESYKKTYTLKSKDNPKAWQDLVQLCKVLNTTPADQLESALAPILDVDGALKFLALEMALVNNDGYWIRTSDYCLYQDEKGRFHVVPHDMNEGFAKPGGPGFGGGRGGGRGFRGGPPGGGPERDVLVGPGGDRPQGAPGGNANAEGPGPRGEARQGGGGPGNGPGGQGIQGVKLDPLYAAKDANKPLISKLLAVPALRAKYLGYVRDIAEKWLDWKKLGPMAEGYHKMILEDVKEDTHKLESFEDFEKSLTEDIAGRGFGPGGGGTIGLKNFADQRREYLLEVTKVKTGAP